MQKLTVHHTSSKGNFSTMENGKKYLAIDLGGNIDVFPHLDELDDILLTHSHQDHANLVNIRKLIKINRNVKFHVYNNDLYNFLVDNNIDEKYIRMNTKTIGFFVVTSFNLLHDVSTNGFIIDDWMSKHTILYATDFGNINDIPIVECNEAYIEGNYRRNMVEAGSRVEIFHNSIEDFITVQLKLLEINPLTAIKMMHVSDRNAW